MMSTTPAPIRKSVAAVQMAGALILAGLIWFACFWVLEPIGGMDVPASRVLFALKCSAVAILLTFLTGVEAVSHERLASAAFDFLAGRESRRLLIDLRYLQNTLEQLVLFVPGLLLLALYAVDGSQMRMVIAAAIVWILARTTFWIGYHIGPQYRITGLIGSVQSMIVLLYVSARFGYELAGVWGAAMPLVLFGIVKAVLVQRARRQ